MDWLEEIAKALPIKEIYQDAAQPAVKQIGQALERTVKTARFVLAPVEYIAAQYVRWERYLERISEKVPEENLIEADPQIAGPVFENLRYAKEDSLIAEMFLNLLARSIDKERVHEAHPAIGHIIGQLHPDEAIILFFLKQRQYILQENSRYNRENNTFFPRTEEENDFPLDQLAFPQNFRIYLDHLYSLNLAWVRQVGNQIPTYDEGTENQNGVIINNVIELMGFGFVFASACIPEKLPNKIIENNT
jgi:hypothetical protein